MAKEINPQSITVMTTLVKNGNNPMRRSEELYPSKQEWRQRLITTLDLWSQEEDAYTLDQFCTLYGLPYQTFINWQEKYKDVRDMVVEVKRKLGDRRWRKAFLRQASETMVNRDLHKYLPEQEVINKYWSDLKKTEEIQSGIQVVYLKEAPKTGKVKPKRKKDVIEVGEVK